MTVKCGICGRQIVRGQALSYVHSETTPKGSTWFAHSARPTTRLGRNDDLADGTGTPSRSRDASARTGSPDRLPPEAASGDPNPFHPRGAGSSTGPSAPLLGLAGMELAPGVSRDTSGQRQRS